MSRISLSSMWGRIADGGRALFHLPEARRPAELALLLCERLISTRGEASGTALAREVVELYGRLDAGQRRSFLEGLSARFGVDPAAIGRAAADYGRSGAFSDYVALAEAVEPPRRELLGRMNMAPGGTAALVQMRAHTLALLRQGAALQELEHDLAHLLARWFNRGFLQIERMDWQSSAAILEKLIAYEAVHEIAGWDDLRRRLAADRRCYAFFHPALPDEPLIFVEVALVEGMADAVRPLIEAPPPQPGSAAAGRADTAIFYSISNCQEGLRGVSFGNFLIKQVVYELQRELPQLSCFATLSPMPGFRAWLTGLVRAGTPGLLSAAEREKLAAACGRTIGKGRFLALFDDDAWRQEPALLEAVRAPLLRLAALYLSGGAGGTVDPVARFHLGNGARVERLNWMADPTAKGLRQSFGLMVNYLYDPAGIEERHEAYARDGKPALSPSVRALAEPSGLARGLRLMRG